MNPELKVKDRVVCIIMDGETSVQYKDWGTVTSVNVVFGVKQYGVNWDNGSKLSLLTDTDIWDTKIPEKKKKITEDYTDDVMAKNIKVFRYYNIKFFKKYLLMIREASFTNMLQAAPYLYTGRERIEHEFKYKDISNEEAFEEVLEHADQSQYEMINGTIRYLEAMNIEETMENINKYVQRNSSAIIKIYTIL